MIDKQELSREVLSVLKEATTKVVAKMDENPEEAEEILQTLLECLSTELGYVESVASMLGMSPDDVTTLRERYLRIGMRAAAQERSAQLDSEPEEVS